MKFIKLTNIDFDDAPIYICAEKIVSIFYNPVRKNTVISTNFDGEYDVKETPEQILEMIKENENE